MTQQAQTPFIDTSSSAMMGLGAPIIQTYDVTTQAASGTITLTPSTSQPNAQPFTKGRLRIKSSGVNAATTIAIGALTGTDGTNTVLLKPALLPVTGAGQNFDISTEFISDLQLISVSFSTTLAGATTAATINSEMFANP